MLLGNENSLLGRLVLIGALIPRQNIFSLLFNGFDMVH